MTLGRHCSFVPPYLLERIAASDSEAADHCRETLAADQAFRAGRAGCAADDRTTATGAAWVVHTAANGSTLPGQRGAHGRRPGLGRHLGRRGGRRHHRDPRRSTARPSPARRTTAKGAEVVLTVHYEQNYDNAFWNGTQLVFGDGDGQVFGSFTKPVDVLGHEFTHAVTQFTADLTYQGQSGRAQRVGVRLLRHVREAAGARPDRRDRRLAGRARASSCPASTRGRCATWPTPARRTTTRTLGKDPQVGDMADYVETTDDNGGVHTNSGIPNRAFYLAATAIGGDTWEGAGPDLVRRAHRRAGHGRHRLRRLRRGDDRGRRRPRRRRPAGVDHGRRRPVRQRRADRRRRSAAPTSVVRVRRTGGIAGRTIEGSVDLSADDPRAAAARDLVDRLDLSRPIESETFPDAFSYTFEVGGRSVTVPQQQLSDDQRALADLLLVRPPESSVRERAVERGGHVQGGARDRPAARSRPA